LGDSNSFRGSQMLGFPRNAIACNFQADWAIVL